MAFLETSGVCNDLWGKKIKQEDDALLESIL